MKKKIYKMLHKEEPLILSSNKKPTPEEKEPTPEEKPKKGKTKWK